jgi:glyoxylase-like metal-dependent hydrolase (beta-lactamase superfamily II)
VREERFDHNYERETLMNNVATWSLILLAVCSGCTRVPVIPIPSSNPTEAPVRIHSVPSGESRVYLIETDAGLVMVDAGWPGYAQTILDTMQHIGRTDLRLIFITHAHFDHYGSAAAIRRATGAPIAIHQADADAMAAGKTPLGSVRSWGLFGKLLLPLAERIWRPEPTTADILFDDGEQFDRFGLNAVAIHTPGHTPGSSCLVVEGTIMFVGDLITSRPWLAPQEYYAHDWEQIPLGIQRVLSFEPQWIFPGHGKPVQQERLTRWVRSCVSH